VKQLARLQLMVATFRTHHILAIAPREKCNAPTGNAGEIRVGGRLRVVTRLNATDPPGSAPIPAEDAGERPTSRLRPGALCCACRSLLLAHKALTDCKLKSDLKGSDEPVVSGAGNGAAASSGPGTGRGAVGHHPIEPSALVASASGCRCAAVVAVPGRM
jgi:hypothetical protein